MGWDGIDWLGWTGLGTAACGPVRTYSMRKGGTDGLAAAILHLSSKLVMSPAGCCLTVLLKLNTPAEVRFKQVNFSEVVKERQGQERYAGTCGTVKMVRNVVPVPRSRYCISIVLSLCLSRWCQCSAVQCKPRQCQCQCPCPCQSSQCPRASCVQSSPILSYPILSSPPPLPAWWLHASKGLFIIIGCCCCCCRPLGF